MKLKRAGRGFLPRYGGGWSHSFGHVYALQQELLDPSANHWFRAIELWHTAREEGLALNTSHYTNILRQCVRPAAWEGALRVLEQMKKDCVRPDVVSVGCVLSTLVEGEKWEQVESVFRSFSAVMKLDSVCFLAVMRARASQADYGGVIAAAKQQRIAHVTLAVDALWLLIDACTATTDTDFAEELVQYVTVQRLYPNDLVAKVTALPVALGSVKALTAAPT